MKTTKLRTKSVDELVQALEAARVELKDAVRSQAAGELANQRVITTNRRDVARIATILAEKRRENQKEEA